MKRNGPTSSTLDAHRGTKSTDQKPAPDHHPDEDYPEVIKLHGMQKGTNQSWAAFYNALKEQAAKCSSRSYDGQIRERIIQSVTDEDLLALLTLMSSPSSEEVFQRCQDYERDLQMFPLIIEYLALPDIRSLSQVSRHLQKIVANYLRHGNITIDDQLLRDYPISRNMDLYDFFAPATNVTMERVTEEHIVQLMLSFFYGISELTLRNMEIMDDVVMLPVLLTKLTVMDFKMERVLWLQWLRKLQRSLKHLHVNRIQTYSNSKHFDFKLEAGFKILETLEIRGIPKLNIEWGSNKIPLKLFYSDAPVFESSGYCCGMSFPYLQSLTLHSWNHNLLQGLKRLNHLKFIGPKTEKSLDEIEKQCEKLARPLNTLEIRLEDTPPDQSNLILSTLNEDCLLKVLEYLDSEDLVSFAKTHRDLYKLVTRYKLPLIDTRYGEFWHAKGNKSILKAAAPFVKELVSLSHTWLIPYCKRLRSLSLISESKDLPAKTIATFPTNLKSFALISPQYRDDPKHFYLEGEDYVQSKDSHEINEAQQSENSKAFFEYMSQLKGLRELTMETSLVDPLFYLRNNRESLVHLRVIWDLMLEEDRDPGVYNHVWDFIGSDMPKLTELSFRSACDYGPSFYSASGILEHLLPRVGHKLLKLDIDQSGFENDTRVKCDVLRFEWLKNLQELSFVNYEAIEDTDVDALCSLKELRVLRIPQHFKNNGQILRIIRELPKLIHFQTGCRSKYMTFKFAKELKETLSNMGDRKMKFEMPEMDY